MIVDEEHVAAALAYLGDAETAARVVYESCMAEADLDVVEARLFLSFSEGSVAEKQARVRANPEWFENKMREAEAQRDLARHKAESKRADAVIEVWRTENANARAAERVR